MKMFIQITLCALLILGFAWLLRMLGCALLTPVRSSRDAQLTLVIRARGDAPELEQLLRGIRWLREGGTLVADVLLIDCGLTDEARRRAELLERSDAARICTPAELAQILQEEEECYGRAMHGGGNRTEHHLSE